MINYIFDLDHTVIDSSHRQLTKADGSLDLAHWIENCSREKIMQDSLLPLAKDMQDLISKNRSVIICTARVLSEHDYDFLVMHGLAADCILSRPEGDHSRDHDLKERLIRQYCQDHKMSFAKFCASAVMFDDNQSVINHLGSFNIQMVDAIVYNEMLRQVA